MTRAGRFLLTMAAAMALAVSTLTVPLSGNRNFVPDWTFTGSSLAEWTPLGQADWRAENGEIVGTPRTADGGWLLLKTSYQDIQFAASFRCTGGCRTGVLLRAEKTPTGMKGVYVTVGPTSAAYAVTLDAEGKELTREPLQPATGMVRFVGSPAGTGGRLGAAPAGPAAPARGGSGPAARAGGPPAPPALPEGAPFRRPAFDYAADAWNTIEAVLDANILRVWLNDGPEAGVAGGRADDDVGRYGPIALYVGGTGEARFRTVETKDIGRRMISSERVSSRFRMQRLNDFYYAWSATSADVNRDGVLDVIAGPFYYLGPDYQVSREIYLSQTNNPSTQYAPAMLNFAYDYTGDGWPDVLVTESRAFVLYVNPGKDLRRWDRFPAFSNSSEAVAFKDMNGDGKPDAIILNSGMVSWARANNANPTEPWIVSPVSGPGYATNAQHGIGTGDINGDGRVDIVHPYGWWEQPASTSAGTPWPYHPAALGRWPRAGSSPGGGEMMVFDVNGDRLNDVVTSLEGHGWGLAWYEQERDAAGRIGFVEHMIMDSYADDNPGKVAFSELHGLTAADIDGDGVQDIIVGKRSYAHLESYVDPDPYGDAVLYWFRTVRTPKAADGVEFIPELIHNRSGVGSAISTADLNRDGAVDILTSGNRGTFIFWGIPASPARGRGVAPPAAAPPARGR